MRRSRSWGILAAVILVAVATVFAGCNLLQYQFCINNFTSYDLKEVNVANQGALSWGPNDLTSVLVSGQSEDIKGFAPGTYMVRGVFDIVDEFLFCGEAVNNELIVVNEGIEITTTNVCIDYYQGLSWNRRLPACSTIYGDVRFEI
ncbi:MAG: hypothetical protein K1Y02_10585 [Candidatus Hydrogenedentes bacterium]|nr:hypothetical protein [Candidatus Hydrogenedentota bacterium]